MNSTEKLAYSTEEACATLGIRRTLLFDLMSRGDITSIKVGRRRLIPAAALNAYIARLVAEAEKSA